MDNTTAQTTIPASTAVPPKTNEDLVSKAKQLLANQQAKPVPPAATSKLGKSVRGVTSLLDALLMKGKISEDEAKAIKFESVTLSKNIEELIRERNAVSEDDMQRIKAEMKGIGFVDLSQLSLDRAVLQKIPKEVSTRYLAVAFEETAGTIKVGMNDPLDLQKIQYLESLLSKKVDAYYASLSDITNIINTKYGAEITKEVDQALASVGNVYNVDNAKAQQVDASDEDAPVIRIVNMILDYAVKHHASDVHIEPRESIIAVRYRINGVLVEKLTIPTQLVAPVVTRIKILAELKIDEHRVPQDGRIPIVAGQKEIDLRVSVVPTIYGEKIVMRLLERGSNSLPLDQTGMRGPGYRIFIEQLKKTQGIVLVTGPTGSGKTNTLASALQILNKPDVNTMTLEDPVEIRMEGVNQVQVNAEVGLTFANGLRAFLRQNPDIIMVGEIRDSETAKLAIQAALTGQLVLATLHTNNAASALPRLIQMGVEPYLLASTINVIVGQRLVRKIDTNTAVPVDATSEQIEKLHSELDKLGQIRIRSNNQTITFDPSVNSLKLLRPNPTPENETGYAGRIGIFEVLEINEDIRTLIMGQSTASDVHRQALQNGMITMMQDGFIKVIEGVTTIDEVLRVVN